MKKGYVRDHPGEPVHIDVKKLARIPDGGGHRMLGRSTKTKRRRGNGYGYIHVSVADASRVAVVSVFPDERGETEARFLLETGAAFATDGIHIESILTDGAASYTRSRAFAEAKDALGIAHLVTKPYRPQTDGKAERFIRTPLEEWAYTRLYRSNEDRPAALQDWVSSIIVADPTPHSRVSLRWLFFFNSVRGDYSQAPTCPSQRGTGSHAHGT